MQEQARVWAGRCIPGEIVVACFGIDDRGKNAQQQVR
jgi:hypothetical protein